MAKTKAMTIKNDSVKISVPAGTYYVGDPCYAFREDRHDQWIQWLEAADYQNSHIVLLAEVPGTGYTVLGFSTAWGDGCYEGSDGNDYPVDAGLIGLVPEGFVKIFGNKKPFGMQKVKFEDDFEAFIDYRGGAYRSGQHHIITLGHIQIETGDGDDAGEW